MKIKRQHGFSSVLLLVIVLAAAAIIAIGWMLAMRQSKADDAKETNPQTATVAHCNTAVKTRQTWHIAYAAKQAFSICVPPGWTMNTSESSENLFAFPPFAIDTSKSPVIQQHDFPGRDGSFDQFSVFSSKESYLGWADTDNNQQTPFTLDDGTAGIRHYTKHGKVTGEGIGPSEGAEDYEYLFDKNGKHYHAIYTIMPGTPNHLQEIESVLKTLSIQ